MRLKLFNFKKKTDVVSETVHDPIESKDVDQQTVFNSNDMSPKDQELFHQYVDPIKEMSKKDGRLLDDPTQKAVNRILSLLESHPQELPTYLPILVAIRHAIEIMEYVERIYLEDRGEQAIEDDETFHRDPNVQLAYQSLHDSLDAVTKSSKEIEANRQTHFEDILNEQKSLNASLEDIVDQLKQPKVETKKPDEEK